MVRLLGLNRTSEPDESPREITTRTISTIGGDGGGGSGESGWLIRFFDSDFFCEWIAVSYLYKHDHPGVRDYLCNRMYTLPLSGIESYLLQICYMLLHKPSPSLDKFVIDICSKSLQIALKVHWFLMAELEDSDEDNEGISRIQEKCQIAATLMGDWPPLVRPPTRNQPMINRILSSKPKFLSLTSSPPAASPTQQRSMSFTSPSSATNLFQDEGSDKKVSSDENKLFKKFMPGTKVRDALFFRKSVDKEEVESDKDGFFRRLLRDSKDAEEELSSSTDGFFKRLFRDSKNDSEDKAGGGSKSGEEDEKDEELTSSTDGFFKRLFRDNKTDSDEKAGGGSKLGEEDEREGFFRRLFKEKHEEKKDANERTEDEERGNGSIEEEEPSDFLSFRRLFRVHPEDVKSPSANENGSAGGPFESSPGTENFFRRLFRDRDRSVEDSELFGLKKHKEKRPGSPKQRNEKSYSKPPLPNNITSQIRKGTYHVSLEFVQSLCETSYNLVDVFPIEDRRSALRESLAEINSLISAAQNSGGVCFPMGKGMYRVVHIPEDEAVLLNSREKAPYLICVEVLKGEIPSHTKETSDAHKLSRGGIPLANGDAQLPKPPPWAYPLWSPQDVHHNATDRLSRSTSQAIDQAMAHLWEAKVKFVHVDLSIEKQVIDSPRSSEDNDLEWVRVMLKADPGVNMEDIEDQEPPRRKDHRRVPSTIAIEEVKAAAAKGEAPPGLPLKGAGQDSSDAQPKVANGGLPKASDALSGELWEVKKERIRKASIHGKTPDWDMRSIIVKSGDDCRQEHLAVQLVSHFYDIFQEAGLPLWLRPYEVLVTSSYTALIETIPDTASLHAIKSRFPNITSLRDFFIAKYEENSPSFKLAQVKDRHNGNLLMDEEGHIIHIDFGFMLSNSPGGVNFESAPFKLTRELLEVMDSDAEGIPSEFFDYFKVLCIQGFLTCRKHAERIILLVEMLHDSGFPCFKGGPRTIENLRKRFHLSLTEEQCVSLVLSLISSSLDAWRTRQYDYYQRVLNGIL
ncbi:phosphatidylinositol 4-kinase beta 1-like isoform X2 [Magnolia sinica]|uniref:phosphatidylinositol 4-kinase beta 1-like isoform X2 n=1 Tax=Magnolia sinica TaxID=86752 RepID=UPI0026590CB8|nr:phosphatidylinositol 4-kinase beta 1-like isoform X2 [Magnolia sinica]